MNAGGRRMKQLMLLAVATLICIGTVHADDADSAPKWRRGLVAHYFEDPTNWDGQWPDELSKPLDSAKNWTFTDYKYSRVEPTVNHLFIKKGWFSVRWIGYLNIKSPCRKNTSIKGNININPNNSTTCEFEMILPDGSRITRDLLTKTYQGYTGTVTSVHIRPKGNGNQNSLKVNGQSFLILNSLTYDITGPAITVKLYNDRINKRGRAMGQWWINIEVENGTINKANDDGAKKDKGALYSFRILADDGCRMTIDGKKVINDWHACWESSPKATRKSMPVKLKDGKHLVVIEYFQGQSLVSDDHDPIKMSWSCAKRGIANQLIPPSAFWHTASQLRNTE